MTLSAQTDASADFRRPSFFTGFARSCVPLLQKTWLRLVLLLAASFLVHLPSLQGQLIWDDNYLVGENPFFRSPIFSLEVFRHYLFLDSLSSHYRPAQNLSYMLDYLVWNGDLYGYHLSNILWHAGAAVLLFLLLRKVLPSLVTTERSRSLCASGAFLIALLWAVHPVHSAAVDYISGRADSLAFVFSCGAWLLYLRARDGQRGSVRLLGYCSAAVLLLLGLCSREIACIWIALFFIHLFIYAGDRSPAHKWGAVIGCLSILGAYAGLRTLPTDRPSEAAKSNWSATARTGLILRALGDYGRLTVLPTGLHMERSLAERRMFQPNAGWRDQFAFGYLTVLGLGVGAAFVFGGMRRGPGRNLRLFGALWFTAGFLPISNLAELNATSAEHWLYLPLVGLLLVVFGWIIELPIKVFRVAVACALLAACALSVRSAIRSSDWLNARVFYERTIAAAGWSPRLGLNLAIIYKGEGRLQEARQLLERTLAAWPDYPLARSHLASTLVALGENEQGDKLLANAASAAPEQIKYYPRNWVAAYQLARKENQSGNRARALDLLVEARMRAPEAWPLVELQSEILRETVGARAALPIVEQFADDNWWQYRAFLALGKLRAQKGDVEGARKALAHACRLDIRETEALNLMTRIELGARNFSAALISQERAVSRQPDEPSQYLLYSEVLTQLGRAEQAREALETAKLLEKQGRASA